METDEKLYNCEMRSLRLNITLRLREDIASPEGHVILSGREPSVLLYIEVRGQRTACEHVHRDDLVAGSDGFPWSRSPAFSKPVSPLVPEQPYL